jgi:hypothetical protein
VNPVSAPAARHVFPRTSPPPAVNQSHINTVNAQQQVLTIQPESHQYSKRTTGTNYTTRTNNLNISLPESVRTQFTSASLKLQDRKCTALQNINVNKSMYCKYAPQWNHLNKQEVCKPMLTSNTLDLMRIYYSHVNMFFGQMQG